MPTTGMKLRGRVRRYRTILSCALRYTSTETFETSTYRAEPRQGLGEHPAELLRLSPAVSHLSSSLDQRRMALLHENRVEQVHPDLSKDESAHEKVDDDIRLAQDKRDSSDESWVISAHINALALDAPRGPETKARTAT